MKFLSQLCIVIMRKDSIRKMHRRALTLLLNEIRYFVVAKIKLQKWIESLIKRRFPLNILNTKTHPIALSSAFNSTQVDRSFDKDYNVAKISAFRSLWVIFVKGKRKAWLVTNAEIAIICCYSSSFQLVLYLGREKVWTNEFSLCLRQTEGNIIEFKKKIERSDQTLFLEREKFQQMTKKNFIVVKWPPANGFRRLIGPFVLNFVIVIVWRCTMTSNSLQAQSIGKQFMIVVNYPMIISMEQFQIRHFS